MVFVYSLFHVIQIAFCIASQTPQQVTSFSVGKENAKIKVYTYISYSCGHCAKFFSDILPQLSHEYVDKKKVVFDFRISNFSSIDSLVAHGFSMISPQIYMKCLNQFYKHQEKIIVYDDERINIEKTTQNIKDFFLDYNVKIENNCYKMNKNQIIYKKSIKPYEKAMTENSVSILKNKILAIPTISVNFDPRFNNQKCTNPPEDLDGWCTLLDKNLK
jgi:hypothetical protein